MEDGGGSLMALSQASIIWRGLTIHGSRAGGPYWFTELEGWEDLPDADRRAYGRSVAHGSMGSAPTSGPRVITAYGSCRSATDRDSLLQTLRAAFGFANADARAEDLTIDIAGQSLTAAAYLTRFRTILDDSWAAGAFKWQAEWEADDPLRYGARISATTSFADVAGGLQYPLYTDGAGTDLGYLDYGAASTQGRLTLTNLGNAATPVQHEVTGPVPIEGFEIVEVSTGARLVFEGAVPAGSRVVLDGATGAVVIDGTQDRAGLLTYRDWTLVAPGASVQFAFLPRGARSDAVLSSSLAPAFW